MVGNTAGFVQPIVAPSLFKNYGWNVRFALYALAFVLAAVMWLFIDPTKRVYEGRDPGGPSGFPIVVETEPLVKVSSAPRRHGSARVRTCRRATRTASSRGVALMRSFRSPGPRSGATVAMLALPVSCVSDQQPTANFKIVNAAALQLTAELQRTALAIKAYRAASPRPVTVVRQQNVAHEQQVTFVERPLDASSPTSAAADTLVRGRSELGADHPAECNDDARRSRTQEPQADRRRTAARRQPRPANPGTAPTAARGPQLSRPAISNRSAPGPRPASVAPAATGTCAGRTPGPYGRCRRASPTYGQSWWTCAACDARSRRAPAKTGQSGPPADPAEPRGGAGARAASGV